MHLYTWTLASDTLLATVLVLLGVVLGTTCILNTWICISAHHFSLIIHHLKEEWESVRECELPIQECESIQGCESIQECESIQGCELPIQECELIQECKSNQECELLIQECESIQG